MEDNKHTGTFDGLCSPRIPVCETSRVPIKWMDNRHLLMKLIMYKNIHITEFYKIQMLLHLLGVLLYRYSEFKQKTLYK